MNEKELQTVIVEVIDLLKKEIDTCNKGKGVYKKILKKYEEALDECQKGNLDRVGIRGGVRFLYDSMVGENGELIDKMGVAEKMVAKFRGDSV